jgi:hypothetical protein
MIPNHTRFPVVALAVVCMMTKDRLSVGKNDCDLVLLDELDDLSRFEGEGGPEAPVPITELIEVPFENAIWRRPVRSAHQTKMTL